MYGLNVHQLNHGNSNIQYLLFYDLFLVLMYISFWILLCGFIIGFNNYHHLPREKKRDKRFKRNYWTFTIEFKNSDVVFTDRKVIR